MGEIELSRRTVIVAGCAGAVTTVAAGCATYGTPPAPPPASTPAGPARPLAKTTDIEVDGGTVFADSQLVITQPQPGTSNAFTAICTHQGCTVADVSAGTINCPCHGSKYLITDGSVAAGPASRPLAAKTVTVQGDSITIT